MKSTDRETPLDSASTLPLSESDASVGRSMIGRYQILRALGRGGMGVVVAAHDPELDREVAVKILVDRGKHSEMLGAALRREAQALARVTHPNVLSVFDAGVDGSPYLVMQLVDGETLGAYLARAKRPPDEIVGLFLQAARGLSAIHAAALIHRDIKPTNILVDKRGVVYVADLGLARIGEIAESGTPLDIAATSTNTIAGTPAYMAPEQFEPGELTPACDQFSFCVALWEALVGERPFRGGSVEEIATSVRKTRPPDVEIAGLSRRQLLALRRGLALDPSERFPSIDALVAELAPSTTTTTKRSPWLVAGGLALAGGAAIAGGLALVAWSSTPSAPRVIDPPAPAPAKPAALELSDARRLTLTDACDEYPSVAPDGTIYYDGIVGPDSHLFAIDPKTRATRELTTTKGWDLGAQVSPDGKRIAFLRKTADMMAAHVADLTDLASAKRIVPGGFRPTWSPDGRFVWAGGRKSLGRYDATTLVADRMVELPVGAYPMAAVELRDARVVVLTKTGSATADGLAIYDAPGAKPRWLIPASDENPMDEVLTLAPSGDGVLVAKITMTNNIEIWHVPLDGSPATAVSGAGIPARKHLAILGNRLVWSDCTEFGTIATMNVTATGATKFVDLARNKWLDFSPIGVPNTDDIVFLSYRSTKDEIWRMSRNGDHPSVIPFGDLELDRIAISHDGTWIVGNNDSGVYAGPIDGSTPPAKILDDDESEQNAAFSRDGATVFVERREGNKDRIATLPRTGGAPTWLLPAPSLAPAPSPTADVLAYLTEPADKPTQRTIMVLDLRTKKSRVLAPALPAYPYRDLRWSPDGTRLLAIRRDGTSIELDVASGKILRTFDVGADQLFGTTYAGDEIFVGRSTSAGDIWEAELRTAP